MSRMAYTGAAVLWEPAKAARDTGPARGGVRFPANHTINATGGTRRGTSAGSNVEHDAAQAERSQR
jgi:hypothetical protein